ncbi:MAG TPA: hypothetical protein DC054_13810 [Blastocatellia bacterium]|nr:hypothetical protein [Blastocatellia bacterium]
MKFGDPIYQDRSSRFRPTHPGDRLTDATIHLRLVAAGATVIVFTTGRGTTIGNAIAPVIKLASNSPVFARMSNDLDLSAGGVIDGTESIDEVGKRVFEHIVKVASGAELAKAEIHKHREFQFWAEQTVSL